MRILELFTTTKKKKKVLLDRYQDTIDKVGREQFQKLVDKKLRIPVVLF